MGRVTGYYAYKCVDTCTQSKHKEWKNCGVGVVCGGVERDADKLGENGEFNKPCNGGVNKTKAPKEFV